MHPHSGFIRHRWSLLLKTNRNDNRSHSSGQATGLYLHRSQCRYQAKAFSRLPSIWLAVRSTLRARLRLQRSLVQVNQRTGRTCTSELAICWASCARRCVPAETVASPLFKADGTDEVTLLMVLIGTKSSAASWRNINFFLPEPVLQAVGHATPTTQKAD